jgi:hypothetical protein
MEAAGIEPASEDLQQEASTRVSSSSISSRLSEEERRGGTSPGWFRSPGLGRARFAILLVDASREPQESPRETAALLRQREVVLLHLMFSTVLRGRWNLDMRPPPQNLRRIQSPPWVEAVDDLLSGRGEGVSTAWGYAEAIAPPALVIFCFVGIDGKRQPGIVSPRGEGYCFRVE